ncbi:MAG: amino acid adenylation domain-containing protein, partial [Anaerolineales bacterium]|nr:amino acid adenylation domain-containing protein [Anaerolineales bacterium]
MTTTFDLLPKLKERGIQLWAEDGKLRFSAPKGALTPELRDELKLHKAELIELLSNAKQPEKSAPAIVATPRATDGPTVQRVSYPQQRLWFLEQLEPGKSAFNISLTVTLNGRLHLDALQQSLNQLVARHESLRTTFRDEHGVSMQVIQPQAQLPLEMTDLQHLPEAEREAEALRLTEESAGEPFNLSTGPLIRARLYRVNNTLHYFIISVHHIISDGWSEGVMQRELTELYTAAVQNRSAELPELAIQYADFSEWQHTWLASEEAAGQLAYWEKQLAGMPPALEMPADFPRPTEPSGYGNELRMVMPTKLMQAMKEFSREHGVTPFMTMLAAFETVLYRQTGQDDIVIGTSIANRTLTEIEPIIGFFLNTLLLRTDLSGNPTFTDLLKRVRQTTLDAFANQQIPIEKLIEKVQPSRAANSPLFQVLFIYQNMPYKMIEWPDLTVTRVPHDSGTAKFDLTLSVMEEDEGLLCLLEYNTDIFEAATIERMFEQMQTLLSQALIAPAQTINDLPLLAPAVQDELIALADGPQLPPPPFTAVPQWFESQVEKSSEKTAVRHRNQAITYAELNQRANQVARYLQKQGVTANSIVGLCLNRSIDMMVGLWGILKAGGAYLPLDPKYPAERLSLMLEDAQVKTIVTQAELVSLLPTEQINFVRLDQDWPLIAAEATDNLGHEPAPDDLAYIIYTSGSTGKPKGVMIPHRALTHFTQAAIHLYDVTADDRMLQFATINFDAAVEEIFTSLVQGATLCLRTDEMLNAMDEFFAQADAYQITMLDLPTAFWHQMVSSLAEDGLKLPESLRLLIIGGEKASGPKVADWHRVVGGKVRLFNTYGPTEVTVVATAYELPADGLPQLVSQGMSIGRALAHGQAFVLDAQRKPVPLGVPGELVLGGPQVALGYLHQLEKTAEVFIPHPFKAG